MVRLRLIRDERDLRPSKRRQKEMTARLLPALAEIMRLPEWEFLDTWDDKYIYISIHDFIAYAIAPERMRYSSHSEAWWIARNRVDTYLNE